LPIFARIGSARADHEGQRARVGGGDAARHRRVDRDETVGGGGFDIRARGRDVDRRAIEQQGARRSAREDFGFIDRGDMLACGEHRHDGFGAGHGFNGGSRARTAGLDSARERLFAKVESTDVVSRVRQIRGHAAAHVSEPDKCDFHVSDPSTRLRVSR
jgi:hypothetical protein